MHSSLDPDDGQRITAEAQRTAERAALRKVRSLVDELEDGERHNRSRQLRLILAGACVIAAVFVFVAMPKPAEQVAKTRGECEWAIYHARMEERRAALNKLAPPPSAREIGDALRAASAATQAAAQAACAAAEDHAPA